MALQRPGGGPAENDVYTILLIIGVAFLAFATVMLAWQFGAFYGFDSLISGPPVIPK